MAYNQIVAIDTIRSIAHGSISGSYAAIGSPLAHPIRTVCITNNTDGDMFVSNDGTNNKLFIAKNSNKLYDLNANRDGGDNQAFKFATGTQFYVKQSTAPTTGDLYLECLYASGE